MGSMQVTGAVAAVGDSLGSTSESLAGCCKVDFSPIEGLDYCRFPPEACVVGHPALSHEGPLRLHNGLHVRHQLGGLIWEPSCQYSH